MLLLSLIETITLTEEIDEIFWESRSTNPEPKFDKWKDGVENKLWLLFYADGIVTSWYDKVSLFAIDECTEKQ